MKQKVKAILSSALGCVLAVLCAASLSACNAPSAAPKVDPKEAAKIAVSDKLNSFSSWSASDWNKLLSSMNDTTLKEFENMGVDVGSFMHTIMSYMQFDVTDVSVDGTKATVKVHVKQLDYNKMATSIGQKLAQDPEMLSAVASGDNAALFKKVFENFETEAKENPVYTEQDVEFTATNDNGTWVVDDAEFGPFFSKVFNQ